MTYRRTRPGTGASGRRAATSTSGSRAAAAARPGTGRAGRPAPALTPRRNQALRNDEADAEAAEGADEEQAAPRASYRDRPQGSNFKVYFCIALVVAAIAGVIAYFPIRRAQILGRLDQAQSAADAEAIAREFLEFTGRDPGYVVAAIRANHGPVSAQLFMAKECKLFSPGVMTVAERPGLPAADLATALQAGVDLYDPERHARDRMPSDLQEWALKHENRDVSINALHLMAKTGDDRTPSTLADVARKPGQDPLRVAAALDSLSELVTEKNLLLALGLLQSNAADQVVQHQRLRERIVTLAGPNHLQALVGLVDSENPAVRALALEAFGGPAMHIPDGEAAAKRREEIGERVSGKITADAPPEVCAAALRAADHLRLYGARDAVLKLVPTVLADAGKYPGIDAKFLAATLGKSFIAKEPDEWRAASEDLIVKLTAALDDEGTRAVAATALSHITEPSFLRLRLALDKLAALGQDPECFAALKSIVTRTYNRPEIVKRNGDDLDKWTAFLAEDRPRYERYVELVEWRAKNQQHQRIADGRKVLQANKDYLTAATEQLNGWVADEKFVAPLGLQVDDVKHLLRDLNDLNMMVRQSLAGATD